MVAIEYTLSPSMITKAKRFSDFRDRCKSYLQTHGRCYDKFTVHPEYDSIIAYLTENFIVKHLRSISKGCFSVGKWQDQFDLDYIEYIIRNNSCLDEDINLVEAYFYDDFDIYISTPNSLSFVSVNIDVKTARTLYNPQEDWEFLYPQVQIKKKNKEEIILLVYYQVKDKTDIFSLNKMIIAGYLTTGEISNCECVHEGEKTKHGTISQIDNYQTELSNYHSVQELIDNYIKL